MMTRMLAIALMLAAASACTTTHGTQAVNDFGRWQQLQPGVTTKLETHALFGQPHEVRSDEASGESVWTYYHISDRMSPSTLIPLVGLVANGSDVDITRADFVFDTDGRFVRSQREERSRFVSSYVALADAITPSDRVASVEREMEALGLPFDRRTAQDVAAWADVTH